MHKLQPGSRGVKTTPRRGPRNSRLTLLFGGAAAVCGLVLFVAIQAHADLPGVARDLWRAVCEGSDHRRYLSWVGGWSVATLLFYGFDKGQALRGRLRVPKKVLHLMALVGGVAGAWVGMWAFRHKVRQLDFWGVLVVASVLHGVFYYRCFWG